MTDSILERTGLYSNQRRWLELALQQLQKAELVDLHAARLARTLILATLNYQTDERPQQSPAERVLQAMARGESLDDIYQSIVQPWEDDEMGMADQPEVGVNR